MEYLSYGSRQEALKGCRKTLGRMSWALAVSFALFQGLSVLLGLWVENLAPGALQDGWISMAVGVLPLWLVGMPLCWLAVRRLPAARPCRVQGVGPLGLLTFFMGSYTVAFLLQTVTLWWSDLIDILTDYDMLETVPTYDQMEFLPSLLVAGILCPILEEVLFRGVLLPRLLPYGRLFAVVASSLMFGLFHGTFFQMLYAFGLGMVFAYITIRTGSLVYATLMHIFYNSFNTVCGFLMLEHPQLAPLAAVPVVFAAVGALLLCRSRRTVACHLRPAPLPAAECLGCIPRAVGFWVFVLCCVGVALSIFFL